MKQLVKRLAAFLLVAVLVMSLTACRRSYTKGEVDENTYTNKWAEVKVTLPEGYKMIDISGQKLSASMNKFDVGCIFTADNEDPKKQTPMCYVFTVEGEQDLAAIGQEFAEEFGGTGTAMNYKQGKTTRQISINKLNYSIAEDSYDVYHISISDKDDSGEVYMALRDVEGTGAFVIYVITLNSDGVDADDIFDMFEKM